MSRAESPAEVAFRDAPLPASGTPWREVDFTVIDFETTGLDPATDEIISFATVTVSGGRVTLADAQYELIQPERMPSYDTIRIHGLRPADLVDAPPLDEVLDRLLPALAGRALVAHVASVERGFLGAALRLARAWSCPIPGSIPRRSTVSSGGSAGCPPRRASRSGSPTWRARSDCRCTGPTTPMAMR